MSPARANDFGILILRLTLGILMLFHGVNKILNGVSPIEGMLQNAGLPGFIAYGVYLGEVVGPLLLILGWYARVGAALIVVNMIFAIALAHPQDIFALTPHGGWRLELQAFFLFTGLALIFTGPGRTALNQR